MKKILFLAAVLLMVSSKAQAGRNDSLYVFSSTVITASNSFWTLLNSTGRTVIVDYTVFSTGTLQDTLDFYDTAVTTRSSLFSWTGFPVGVIDTYPVGVETTTGTHISFVSSNANTVGKVRVRYYRSYIPTTP